VKPDGARSRAPYHPRVRAVFLWLCVAACGTEGPRVSSPIEPDRRRLSEARDRADGVGTFTSSPWSFDTNSFWIEGPEGLVFIDTQFLPSEAERSIALAERETGKRVVLAIVLHPNPDKFNGTEVFRAHGARVVTSAQVLAAIPAVAAQRRRAFMARYAPDYPARDPELEAFGDASTTLRQAGLELEVHVLGRGCSEAHVVVKWNEHVFAGDLIAAESHSWLELGYVEEWLERLREIEALGATRVHPGRGPSGGPERITAERAYLERVLELVRARAPSMPAPAGAIDAIRAELVDTFPTYRYDVFLRGLSAVWARQARD
jgi:glyoxylase-like metal-dependent hydrolase (beta-lactamase superfamily II)